MEERSFIVATAGHVDHGKSTLVSSLTGADPDRLPEEKRRGITIEPGFAELAVDSPSGPASVQFVDVPGHEDYVRNMVGGLWGIDAALLVVAADSGWMPQSEEHLQILEYLGISRGVVALNKIDLEGIDASFAEEVVRDDLKGSLLAQAPIVPLSALRGQGTDRLRQALGEMLEELPPSPDLGRPRLSVDRAFSIRGHGTVVTGSLRGGPLRVEDEVELHPSGIRSRIRSLQCFGRPRSVAGPGRRVAANLSHVGVREGPGAPGVGRGDVLAARGQGHSVRILDVAVRRSPRLLGGKGPSSRPLRHGRRVRFHHGSASAAGRIYLQGAPVLEPGEERIAQLRLEEPVMALCGDRFVLRDWSESGTLAGGTILDAQGSARRFRSSGWQRHLAACLEAGDDALRRAELEIGREGFCPRSETLARSPLGPARIRETLEELEARGTIRCLKQMAFLSGSVRRWLEQAGQWVAESHRDRPEEAGMPLSDLRSRLSVSMRSDPAAEAILQILGEIPLVVESDVVRDPEHRAGLPPGLDQALERLRRRLGERPEEPPSLRQLALGEEESRALRYLINSGQARELGPDLALLDPAYRRLRESIVAFLEEHGEASVSQLRTHTGVSRRIMLPLLQRLDLEGLTLRQGDYRRLRER